MIKLEKRSIFFLSSLIHNQLMIQSEISEMEEREWRYKGELSDIIKEIEKIELIDKDRRKEYYFEFLEECKGSDSILNLLYEFL